MAHWEYVVEIRGRRDVASFDTKAMAEAYAVSMTAWSGGQYRITEALVGDPAPANN
jgi:hypothetical protein